jgi:hypothetical protein
MYDRNGLQLAASNDPKTKNSYRMTSVDLKERKYFAYARASRPKGQMQWSMFKIAGFNDPRDAAFVAQEFEKQHKSEYIRELVTDGLFYKYAKEFAQNIDIPEWKYPAEGYLIEDHLNDYGYKVNRVDSARDALVEAIKVFGLKPPSLKEVPNLIAAVEKNYEEGMSYREAARNVMNVKENEHA